MSNMNNNQLRDKVISILKDKTLQKVYVIMVYDNQSRTEDKDLASMMGERYGFVKTIDARMKVLNKEIDNKRFIIQSIDPSERIYTEEEKAFLLDYKKFHQEQALRSTLDAQLFETTYDEYYRQRNEILENGKNRAMERKKNEVERLDELLHEKSSLTKQFVTWKPFRVEGKDFHELIHTQDIKQVFEMLKPYQNDTTGSRHLAEDYTGQNNSMLKIVIHPAYTFSKPLQFHIPVIDPNEIKRISTSTKDKT